MVQKLLGLLLGVLLVVGCASCDWNQKGKHRGGNKNKNVVAGSDKHYLWTHRLNAIEGFPDKDVEFRVSDGNDKIITWDGVFTVNGETLATDGIWLNKKKFTVYVPKWKGWWVGKVIFNNEDNVRGMKSMFIPADKKQRDPPQKVRKQQPQRLEQGSMYFKSITKSTDSKWNEQEEKKQSGSNSCSANGDKNEEDKWLDWHTKWHKDHGYLPEFHHNPYNHHGYGHGHHHHHHGCCGLFARVIGVLGLLFFAVGIVMFLFRAAFDDVFADCCVLSMLKMKLDMEHGEFNLTWKKKGGESKENENEKENEMENDRPADDNEDGCVSGNQAPVNTSDLVDDGEE